MLPEGWKLTTLGEVCSGKLQTGPFGSQLHSHEYVERGVSVIMPKDLINCRVVLESAAKIPEEKAHELKKHQLVKGDLIFSRRGDVARFALIDEASEGSLCGTGCLKATPNQKHSPLFLSYFMQKDSIKQWLEQNSVGQTMPNMNTEILRELPLISASSRQEEDKIAQILSTWDKAITTTEQLIANSQQQKKALLQQLLTGKKRLLDDNGVRFSGEWEEIKLGDLGVTFNGLTGKTKDDFGNGSAYIPYMNIFANSAIKLSQLERVNIKTDEKQNIVQRGDIFFTTSSETPEEVGMASVLLENPIEPTYLNSFCFGFRPISFEKVHPEFMQFCLRSLSLRRKISELAQGATRYNLSKNNLMKVTIHIPSIEEQQKIAAVLSSADREIEALQGKLTALKQEKKALMQQLLTGKRRVFVHTKENDDV